MSFFANAMKFVHGEDDQPTRTRSTSNNSTRNNPRTPATSSAEESGFQRQLDEERRRHTAIRTQFVEREENYTAQEARITALTERCVAQDIEIEQLRAGRGVGGGGCTHAELLLLKNQHARELEQCKIAHCGGDQRAIAEAIARMYEAKHEEQLKAVLIAMQAEHEIELQTLRDNTLANSSPSVHMSSIMHNDSLVTLSTNCSWSENLDQMRLPHAYRAPIASLIEQVNTITLTCTLCLFHL
jgi:hypothetical protein